MKINDLENLMIDDPATQRFEVARRLFNDEALFEQEMKHIFEGNWVYLCHESQVANRHDYFTTHIGRQPVFVQRGGDGVIRGFVNACPHRGATLCRTAKGSRKFIACSYHGWTFDSTGKNVDVKDRDSGGYPDSFLQQAHDLTQLGRLEVYAGFVFGSLNPDVEPLTDYLGQARPFVEMLDEMGEQGCEVLPGCSTYIYKGNWKMQAENGIDGYHFTTIHANYVGVIARREQIRAAGGKEDQVKVAYNGDMMKGFGENGSYDLENGHAVIWINFPKPENRPLWEQRDTLAERVGQAKADWMLHRQRNLLVYPNVQLMEQASSQIRVFRPLAYNRTEVKIYCIAPKGESIEARTRRIRQYEDFFNATGLATPDDLREFEGCQEGFEGRAVAWQQGYDRGYAKIHSGPDEYAKALGINPVSSVDDATFETLYFGQYRKWRELMSKGMARDVGQ